MNKPSTDIIVPVWNRPVETRNCLVNLINHSPEARLILVDNGCDRDTERMLEEFAEELDHRAILLRNDVNQGYVRAVNRGLARSDAGYMVVISNTSAVTPSWLEPLTSFAGSRGDAGILVPRLINGPLLKTSGKPRQVAPQMEADHASMAAMFMTRQAYDSTGGLDEEMDGGIWGLRDLSRRAYRAGLYTFRVGESVVYYEDIAPLGSVERRNAVLQRSIALYRERWGEARSFSIHMPKAAGINAMQKILDLLLTGARQGHFFSVNIHGRLFNEITKAGMAHLHEHIRFVRIPFFFESKAIDNSLKADNPVMREAEPVAGIDGTPFSEGIEGMPFAELERTISAAAKEIYGG